MATRQSSFPFSSAKGVSVRSRKTFGSGTTWPFYSDLSQEIEKPAHRKDGVLVPLDIWTKRREELNAKRRKPYDSPVTCKTFKTNIEGQLKRVRGKKDFTIQIAEDEAHLIVRIEQ